MCFVLLRDHKIVQSYFTLIEGHNRLGIKL